jgi:hypothetical protein
MSLESIKYGGVKPARSAENAKRSVREESTFDLKVMLTFSEDRTGAVPLKSVKQTAPTVRITVPTRLSGSS